MLSSLDGQQVEEQLKVAERRLGDVERRLPGAVLCGGVGAAREEEGDHATMPGRGGHVQRRVPALG